VVERTCIMATESTDEKKNRQLLEQLLDKPGNGTCADCGAPGMPIRWGARASAQLCLLQPSSPDGM
jgi:RNA polymerase-binding transcription factor DksA